MTLVSEYQPVSMVLDPSFCHDLQATAHNYDANQENTDNDKWAIATQVNSMWQEHEGLLTKAEYYAECSRVANIGLKKKRFSDSGETLRRWCEVVSVYSTFPKVNELLTHFSFEHLRIAKSLNYCEKVKSPIEALNRAMVEKWTAQEMEEHYNPKLPLHPYDNLKTWLTGLMNKNTWSFMKSKDDIEYVRVRLKEIQDRVSEVLKKEGKAG